MLQHDLVRSIILFVENSIESADAKLTGTSIEFQLDIKVCFACIQKLS
jgi:hypothetical protein